MPQYTLYRANGACSLVPHILLTEFKIPFDEVLMKSSGKGYEAVDGSISLQEYLKIHPSGYVPALKIDNEILTENSALQTYIQTFAPERQLLGKTPLEQARVAEYMSYISGSIHSSGLAMYGRPARFSDNEAHHESIKKKGVEKLHECFGEVDKRIGDRDFAVGSQDTLADYYLFYFYYVAQSPMVRFKMAQYPNYTRLAKRLSQNESVKAVMLKEGLTVSFD